jgi:mycofactocin system transcriptional regulator
MADGPGRPKVTTKGDLERVALQLFAARGFDATTVEDIAEAAGISRRTFFRYYPSKNDVVWGDFDGLLAAMRSWLAGRPDGAGLLDSLVGAVVRFNSLPVDAVPAHRQRMELILGVPALQAHSTLRYREWRAVVADFVAARLGLEPEGGLPQLVGHLALAAAVASYEQWLARPDRDLEQLLTESFRELATGLAGVGGGLEG